jgi:type II secretory pathway component PulJ
VKTNKKIEAFTLSEIIVVLILTSIVVGLAFSVLGLVQKQMLAIQTNYNKSLELQKLETSLWIDFNRYPNIRFDTSEDQLIFKHELDSIFYTFSKDIIIKVQDTFLIPVETKQFYFDGVRSKTSNIDAIKLKTAKAHQNRELFIFKKNDATTYMN